ncbi:MAG: Smr/MutS family protein, partial [Haliscomenobacter sp.]
DHQAFDKLIRELREEKNLEKARELASKAKESRQVLQEQVVELKKEVYQPLIAKGGKPRAFKQGDYVRLIQGGATGMIEAIKKEKAIVLVGQMRMTIPLHDLVHSGEPLEVKAARSIQTDTTSQNSGFQSKLDIRGMRMEEALQIVESFVDHALLTSASHLRIVHGKGNGILRKAVRTKLKEYRIPMDITHPEPELGGDGVTLIEIK